MALFSYMLTLITVTSLTEVVSSQESSVMSTIKAVRDGLFKDYDPLIRPLLNDSGFTTHVAFAILPKYIVDVDESKSLFTMDSFIYMQWTDPRLRWSRNDTKLRRFTVPRHMIWHPDLSLRNSHSAKVDPYQDVNVYLISDGTVFWITPATLATFCAVAERDDVTCHIEFGSWTHDGFEISLDKSYFEIYMRHFQNTNPRWKLNEEEITMTREIHNFSADEFQITIKASFPMVRLPSPQLRLVRTPCILVSVLVLALLCSPPQEYYIRLQLGTFLFFVLNMLVVYASASADTLQQVKSAVALVRITTIVLTAFLVMQVVTMKLNRCSGHSRPNATLVRWLSTPLAGRFLFCKRSNVDGTLTNEGKVTSEPSAKDEWALVAAAMDRIIFAICFPTLSFCLFVD